MPERACNAVRVEEKLKELDLELPEVPEPVANYIPAKKSGSLVFVSGQSARKSDGSLLYVGKVGREFSVDEGYDAARQATLGALAAAKSVIGSLEEITEVVRVRGFVNCTPDFGEQPEVINGASDLLVELFGESGRHARSALGSGSLPRGIAVEVELVVAVD
jgi:enamine deaminase RidA (YjgF/YER057c/UK114 family)